jgi:membrane-bound lytic murein transglycosylase D
LFHEHGLPEELAYLPIIESGYRFNALSRARARGVWQFMAATARMFGLRVDWVVDERLDPFKSALAAAKYLKTLYKDYGDWYLALACYNGGTRRVDRAIRRLRSRDFFRLARTRYLRRETRNYVPAFLASVIIARSPEEYGFVYEGEPVVFVNTRWIELPSPVDLAQISRLSGVPVSRIKQLNPELIRDFTPFNIKTYRMRFPSEIPDDWIAQIKRLPPEKKYFVGWYRVKRGDNLYQIARRFGTSVWKIKRVNKLKSNMIHPGDRLLIPRG